MPQNGKFRREDLRPGEVLCDHCTAKCCQYFAFPIDTPTSWKEFDYLRWFMLHGRVGIFVDDGTWYMLVYAACKHLQPDHRCGIYESRPQICRDYTTDACEFEDDSVYDKYFETPEQIWEYAQAVLPPEKQHRFSSAPVPPTKVALPVLG